jgi:hypothetical protein
MSDPRVSTTRAGMMLYAPAHNCSVDHVCHVEHPEDRQWIS